MVKKEIIPGFYLHDLIQVIIGATILAIPVGITDETWQLSKSLPIANTLSIMALSIIFVGTFTYYHYHGLSVKKYWKTFFKRTFLTYIATFALVFLLLNLIDKAELTTPLIAFKRIVIISLPASMSAAIADTIR